MIRALAGIVDDAGRATDVDAAGRRRARPRGDRGHRPQRRHRDPPLPQRRGRRCRRWPSPASRPAVDFGAKDGPADLAFLIAAPAGGDASHLKLLAKLARALVKKEFTDSLRAATTPAEVVALVSGVVGDEAAAAPHPLPDAPAAAAPATVTAQRTPFARGRDRLPDRHRPHLHGR